MANHFELRGLFLCSLMAFLFQFCPQSYDESFSTRIYLYLKGINILGFQWKFQYFYQYFPLHSTWIPHCPLPPTPIGGCSWNLSQLPQPSSNFVPLGSLESSLLVPEWFRGKPWIWGDLLSVASFFFSGIFFYFQLFCQPQTLCLALEAIMLWVVPKLYLLHDSHRLRSVLRRKAI